MTRYASSTPEARELVSELSFVWDQIKNLSPQQSASSTEESPIRSEHAQSGQRMASRGEVLLELEPRSEDRYWEGAIFTDGEDEADVTRGEKKYRKRINRAVEGMKMDIARLREEIDALRRREGSPKPRGGMLAILGRWIVRFVGVQVVPGDAANIVPTSTCVV